MANWLDVLMDEDPVGNPVVDLPTENEKEGEKEAAGHEAAGALSEDDSPAGVKTEEPGKRDDEITKQKPNAVEDFLSFLDKDEDEDTEEEEDKDSKKDDDEKGSDDDDASKSEPLQGEDDEDKKLKDFLSVLDEDTPENPKVDLPSENEKEGEKEAAGHEASGALSEDDDPNGVKSDPAGDRKDSVGDKPSDFDDVWSIFDKDDEDEDGKADAGADDAEGEEDGKEDKEDKKSEKKEEEEKPSDDDEPIKDFSDFFVDADVEEPDGLPSGSTAKPAEPVDGNGHDVDPIGDPDLPSNLTEPVLVPVASPAGGKDGELKNAMNIFDDDNSRFFFGDFSF